MANAGSHPPSDKAEVKICVVGSSNIDLLTKIKSLPRLGETLLGDSFQMGFGGKGANQAVMAALLGAHVSIVTKLGQDQFGQSTLQNFREHGIETDFVLFDKDESSGVAPIFVDSIGNNMIVVVPGANMKLTPDDALGASRAIQNANVLVCQLETPVETTHKAFEIANKAGTLTILNAAPARPLPNELVEATDIMVVNETECEVLTSISVSSLDDAAAAAAAFTDMGVNQGVVITLGKKGAFVSDKNGSTITEPLDVEATDTTGAGDAFVGSLAVYLAEGKSLAEAAKLSNIAAGICVTRIGTQVSFPNRVEIEKLAKADE